MYNNRLYLLAVVRISDLDRKELPMKLRYLFIVDTVVALVFAAGLLLAPKTMLNLFGFGVAFFVGMLPKVMSSMGWSIVILFLFFAVGFAYFLFMKPSEI